MSSTAKTAYVETGITLTAPVYSAEAAGIISAPQSLTMTLTSHSTSEGVQRGVLVQWAAPVTGIATSYKLLWRKDNANWNINVVVGTVFEFPVSLAGTYDVLVYAINAIGVHSIAADYTLIVDLSAGVGSGLNPVTAFALVGGGTSFTGPDINVVFTNPSTNNNLTTVLKDFEVAVYESSTLLRTEYIGSGANPGDTLHYSYTFAKNVEDGGPRRSIRIVVKARDVLNKTSTGNDLTFSNPAPAVISGISVVPALGGTKCTFTLPPDYDFKGVLIWGSKTTGFTPGVDNLLYDGSDNYVAFNALTGGDTWYYRFAAYDTFSPRDYTGTGLNVSGESSAVVLSETAGVPKAASAPSGVEGDVYYNTTDKHLYQYTNAAWIQVTTDLVANSVTSAHIAANTITAADIATGTITANEIAAATITADRMNVSTLSSVQSSTGTLIVNSGGHVRGGQTAYNTGTGFYLGNDGGVPKFSLGVAGSSGLTWDGATFTVAGNVGSITIATGGHIKMGQTAFNTGTGFFLGDSGGVPKFSIGSPSGHHMTWDGVSLVVKANLTKVYAAGSLILASAPTSRSPTYNSTFQKLKEIAIDGSGTITAYYNSYINMQSTGTGGTIYVEVRKNGTLVSGGSFTDSHNYTYPGGFCCLDTPHSVNIAVNSGDAIQLWAKVNTGSSGAMGVENFSLQAAQAAAPTVNID